MQSNLTITRRFEFDMGHRVLDHGGLCRFPHGHRYVMEIALAADFLDELGMVVDFGEIKERVGVWLRGELDHGFMIYEKDSQLIEAIQFLDDSKYTVVPFNPTAENIVKWLVGELNGIAGEMGCTIERIDLWETPNCRATWIR